MPRTRIVLFAHADWLVRRRLAKYFSPSAEEKQNGFCRYIVTNEVTLWSASYSACVYTETIIPLNIDV